MAVWGANQRVVQGVGEQHMRRPTTLALVQREWAPLNPFAVHRWNLGGLVRQLLPGGGVTLVNLLGPVATNLILVGSVGFPCFYQGAPFARLQPRIRFVEDPLGVSQCNFRCVDNAQYNPNGAGDSWAMVQIVNYFALNTGVTRQVAGKRSSGFERYELAFINDGRLQWTLGDAVGLFNSVMTANIVDSFFPAIVGWTRTANESYLRINGKEQTISILGAGAFSSANGTGFHYGNITGLNGNVDFLQTAVAEQDLSTTTQREQLRHNVWRGYNSASRPQP